MMTIVCGVLRTGSVYLGEETCLVASPRTRTSSSLTVSFAAGAALSGSCALPASLAPSWAWTVPIRPGVAKRAARAAARRSSKEGVEDGVDVMVKEKVRSVPVQKEREGNHHRYSQEHAHHEVDGSTVES